MAKRMLIDASHSEETRVVVLSGTRIEDFDYETASKKQLKGNIYLAKITRVEPSLQAAFVEYGGNRHGFLPFSEIHPDYYRIPIADRQALIAEEATLKSEDDEEESEETTAEAAPADTSDELVAESPEAAPADGGDATTGAASSPPVVEIETATKVDTVGGDEVEEAARRRAKLMRRYKIQEVIKRRQVILIQVVKEERGNKGAALTTYLSLAGRYCVLMPNTNKGGGISRKISSTNDRRRLRKILNELEIPGGVAVIVRTAGSQRSKAEIRRDYEYLLRLWNEIRETTLESTAPSLIYEEASLIKRSIRDVYNRDTDEILVEGEEGHKAAKAFMKSLMPSHARKVQLYKDEKISLFQRCKVESQLEAMHSNVVQLRSGGYIVLNSTEALVAIDVNSGKATRERHIEETALKTNLEAADEIGRQLRLRDLAGLIVIDFIDMEEQRRNREVERRLKEALKYDRARIQLGRISPFGLLEMSRQRLRPSLFESSTMPCPSCGGSGHIRTIESAVLRALRALEEEAISRGSGELRLSVSTPVALYILNQKRDRLIETEQRYGLKVLVERDDALLTDDFVLERTSERKAGEPAEARTEEAEEGDRKAGRSRRGRRRKAGEAPSGKPKEPDETSADEEDAEVEERPDVAAAGDEESGEAAKKRRRRGKRGGRRRARKRPEGSAEETPERGAVASDGMSGAEVQEAKASDEGESAKETGAETDRGKSRRPRRARRPRKDKTEQAASQLAEIPTIAAGDGKALPEKVMDDRESAAARATPPGNMAHDAPAASDADAHEDGRSWEESRDPSAGASPSGNIEPQPEANVPVAAPSHSEPERAPAAANNAGGSDDGDDEEDRPRRRGWWNRFM